MILISWNIDSLNAALTATSTRAEMSRNVIDTIKSYSPDIIALQETKLPEKGPSKKHKELLEEYFPTYNYVWRTSKPPARKGYSGTMFLVKKDLNYKVGEPIIGAPTTMDDEGRILDLEFDDFFISQVYTPNAGDGLSRLEDRQEWDKKYADYLCALDKEKIVIACGDYNVAHEEIDLANPSGNRRSAGFTDEERKGFTNLLSKGFIDTFRYLHGGIEGMYTWWAQRVKTSKINNSGWRIDYWIVSDRIKEKIIRSEMIDSGERQDHTPILLEIDI